MNDFVRSYVAATNGLAPSANLPVRLYQTATTSPDRVQRCTGGEDTLAVGIARRGVTTSGLPVAVAVNPGFTFLGQVSTTVKQGDKLQIKNGASFKPSGTTAGLHYCAVVDKARTNSGLTWLTWVGVGTV